MREDHYELLYILPMKFAGEEQETIIEKVNKIIKDQDCKITHNKVFGKQKLAYPIKKVHQGVYILIEFDGEKSAVQKINNVLKLTPEVLRHLIVTKKKLTEEEIAKQKKRKERLVKQEKQGKDEAIRKQVEEIKEDKREAVKPAEDKEKKEKVSLEDLDKKLDEILKDDIGGV